MAGQDSDTSSVASAASDSTSDTTSSCGGITSSCGSRDTHRLGQSYGIGLMDLFAVQLEVSDIRPSFGDIMSSSAYARALVSASLAFSFCLTPFPHRDKSKNVTLKNARVLTQPAVHSPEGPMPYEHRSLHYWLTDRMLSPF